MGEIVSRSNGYSQLAADVLAMARRNGATEADIVIADGENLSVQVRLGAVDRLSKAKEKRLGLRVFVARLGQHLDVGFFRGLAQSSRCGDLHPR